ncbi:MAG TPA: PKD domain-containing protein [Candidatus Hydrogenedentes bacterium]|nr:PKD domain-containing protein [Candidatus Hydrogenedentota bacterium]
MFHDVTQDKITLLGIAMLLMLAGILCLATTAHAIEPAPPIEVSMQANKNTLGIGQAAQVVLSITPLVDVPNGQAEFTVLHGDANIMGPKTVTLGPLTKDRVYTATTTVTLASMGKSEIRGTVSAMDDGGNVMFWNSAPLFLVAAGDKALAGDAGYSALELEIAKLRHAEGGLAKADYERELERILTGGAAEEKALDNAGAKQSGYITVSGDIRWTDGAGTTHVSRYVDVEIRDKSIVGSELVTTVSTGYSGSFYAYINNTDTYGLNGRDIFIRVLAQDSTYGRVLLPDGSGNVQSMESSVTEDVADGSTLTINLTANNVDDNNKAFSVHDALVTIASYTPSIAYTLPRIDTLFPIGGTASFYDGSKLNIRGIAWVEWDVIHHEFGHYFTDTVNIEDNPGGTHYIDTNAAEDRGKNDGTHLAWDEGFATYFGTTGQIQQNASSLNIPRVGDTRYSPSYSSIDYDLDTIGSLASLGEDHELAVQRILYDLYDSTTDGNDEVTLGAYTVYRTAHDAGATTLSAFWNQLISGASMLQKVSYGGIFMDHKVSPEPTNPLDGEVFSPAAPPPAFNWNKNGAGPSFLLNKFTVEFWNADFTTLYFTSPEVDGPPWTPTGEEWATILGSGDIIKWVVKGRNTSAPATGTYISCARTIGGADIAFVIDDTGSMTEEIGGVRSALTAFVADLVASSASVVVNVITFKDDVTSRIVSKDLSAIQSVVSSLYASWGDDCPEASVEALNLASKNTIRGGRILFATDADAHAGLNISSTIAALRAKGIRVDVLLSASCSESWKRGTYFTTSTGVPYFIPPHCNEGNCLDEIDPIKTPPECDGPDCISPVIPPEVYPTGAIAVFSSIAAETAGIFSFVPEVNAGSPTRFNNVALSIMTGAAFPSIPDVNPPQGNRGSSLNILITASSTNFNATSQLAISGGGVTINSGATLSATKYQANITIAPDAELGFRDVTITTELGVENTEEAVGRGIFQVEDVLYVPTIVSVSPAQGGTDETLDVIVTAANTHFDGTSMADFGTGITVNSFTPTSLTEGVANITIAADAVLGYRSVSVNTTSSSEYADESIVGPFLVVTKTLAETVAKIDTIDPATGTPGTSLNITVTGTSTHFVNGVSVGSFSGGGITVNSTTIISATEAELNITIASLAEMGFRDVMITTGSEVAAALDAFEVSNVNAAPVANAGDDQTLTLENDTINVVLNGSASSDSDGTIVAYHWSGTPDPDDVAGPTVTLGQGEYTFTLIVEDNNGALSQPDTVTITINAAPSRTRCNGGAGTISTGFPKPDAGDALLLIVMAAVLLCMRNIRSYQPAPSKQ